MICSGEEKIMLIKIKNGGIFWGIILHAAIMLIALTIGYNSYKEIMQDSAPIVPNIKASIKAAFPWAILIYSFLYLALSFKKEAKGIFLNIWQYVVSIILYLILLNLFFFSKGRDTFIPINLSALYFLMLLIPIWGIYRFFMPKNLDVYLIKSRTYIKKRPSAILIISFILLFIISSFLLLEQKKIAEYIANAAYFLLIIGVGMEVYQSIKHGKRDEKR
jgi:hypothetical protein